MTTKGIAVLLSAVLLGSLLIFLSGAPGASAQVQSGAQPAPGTVAVSVQVVTNPNFDAFGSGTSGVVCTVAGSSLHVARSIPVEMLSNFKPIKVAGTVVAGGQNSTLAVTVSSGRFGTSFAYDFVLPGNTTSFALNVSGASAGSDFLWRYITSQPAASVSGLTVPLTYSATMQLPKTVVVSQLYDGFGNPLPLSLASPRSDQGQLLSYALSPGISLVVLQPSWLVPAGIIVTALALVAVILAAMTLFGGGRKILQRGAGGVMRLPFSGPLRSVKRQIRSLCQPKKLLTLFILCALLMVAVGVVAGPDPRVKAYVISNPSSVTPIQRSISSFAGSTLALTPQQDYTDFGTMSSVGEFNLVVVSNYPALALPPVEQYVLGSLGNVPLIIVDKSADPSFVSQIETLYGDNVVHVNDAANLNSTEQHTLASLVPGALRLNVLGLRVSSTGFEAVLAFEAAMSFVLIFLGWAFLGSLKSESVSQSDLQHLGTIILSGVFVFSFSEVVYVTTSSILAVPLSLHAVISGARDVTAVGLLGFGGGSTPRLAAGFAGILFGLVGSEGGPKIKLGDLGLVGGIVLVLLASPLFVGQFAFQGVLLVASNFGFGAAYTSSLSFKGFLYGIGSALGGGASPTYLMSAGKMLYFSGLLPFAYLRKMGPTMVTIAGLAAAFLLGDGGVRVGEMTPDKTVIAVMPGIVAGFLFVLVLLGLSLGEKYVRGIRRE